MSLHLCPVNPHQTHEWHAHDAATKKAHVTLRCGACSQYASAALQFEPTFAVSLGMEVALYRASRWVEGNQPVLHELKGGDIVTVTDFYWDEDSGEPYLSFRQDDGTLWPSAPTADFFPASSNLDTTETDNI